MEMKPIDATYLEMLSVEAVKNRRLHLNETVDDISIFKILYNLDKIVKIDDIEEVPINERKPIDIVVNSYGGQLYECLALISKMKHLISIGYNIRTICTGKAMSCGHLIFVCGSERILYRYATLMVHELSSWCVGNYTTIKNEFSECTRLEKLVEDIICENTNITKQDLNENVRGKDWYIDSNLALALNCCDKIV